MRFLNTILFLFCTCIFLNAQVIKVGTDNRSWTLKTNTSLYHISVSNSGEVNLNFFGDCNYQTNTSQKTLGPEITVRGGFNENTPMVEAIFKDGVRSLELQYLDGYVQEIDGYSTLVIVQKDKHYPITIKEYLRVLPEYDIIEKWIEVLNTAKKETIILENIQSGTFFVPEDTYELTHLSGAWADEFLVNKTLLTQGTKTLQVKDFRSFGSSFFTLNSKGQAGETYGNYWYGSLQYSGNWRVDFEKYTTGKIQVTAGINFWDQTVTLKAGQTIITPKFVIGYTSDGMESVSLNLASYTREQIMHKYHRQMERPVLYNSWYATTFDVNEEHQLRLAAIAKEIGVETFVIDDGWFKGRNNDTAGLGDWTVDKKKFPNGLKSLISKINDMGLDFGIWIEPEMVNPNSDLYRAHPDWVLHYPNRTRHEGRNQLILNLAREDVYQYLYDSFSKLLRENNITYIKWDMNRALADPGLMASSKDNTRAIRMKYVENLYRLLRELRAEFPNVWFENCASGGGRIDLGIMQLTDCNWVSDNTDPIDRIFIQHAYLNAFPANSMISWVTQEDWHKSNPSLEYKFDVSMAGVLGIGYDITKWTEDERRLAKQKISEYKSIRETVQFGSLYRLVSPYESNRSILQYVNKSGKQAVVFVYNLGETINNAVLKTTTSTLVRLRGLEESAKYIIEGCNSIYTGSMLMNIGINLPLKGAYKSRIYKVKKVE